MKCFGMLIDGRARPTGVRQRGTEATMLLVLNSHHDLVKFTLPDCASGTRWQLLIDTNVPAMDVEFNGTAGDVYGITGCSLVLYIRLG